MISHELMTFDAFEHVTVMLQVNWWEKLKMSETNLTNIFEYVHFLGVALCYLCGFIYFANVQSYCENTYSDISTDMLFTCTGYDVRRCQDDDE